jgi:hypothetical protein
MSVRLKLNHRELDLTIRFIECTLPKGKLTHYGKLIDACLCEMLAKLAVANVIVKDKYQITLPTSVGLGFLLHCKQLISADHDPEATPIVNKIIGLIDQKAA